MTEVAKVVKEKKVPVQISVGGILADLDAGLDREAIKAKYGISHSDMALLFKEPALKGRKPKGGTRAKKAPGFILVQDTEAPTSVAPSIETVAQTMAVSEPEVLSAPAAEQLDKW